jgi:peptide/nickel transport system permease protein
VRRWRDIAVQDPLAAWSVPVLALIVLAGLIWPLLPIPDPAAVGVGPRIRPPSMNFLLGTDTLGRSLLARVLQGIRTTLLLSTVAVLIAGTVGALLGMISGYVRGAADELVTRVADIMFAFPPVLLGLLVTATYGPGQVAAIAVIVVFTVPTMIRVVRSATMAIRHRDFVLIAEVLGASFWRRLTVHLLPNVLIVIIVQTVYSISFAMLVESALSFLGLGVQPPGASLGSLLREGSLYLGVAPWMSFAPGVILSLAILAINLFGDFVRRVIDPLASELK